MSSNFFKKKKKKKNTSPYIIPYFVPFVNNFIQINENLFKSIAISSPAVKICFNPSTFWALCQAFSAAARFCRASLKEAGD